MSLKDKVICRNCKDLTSRGLTKFCNRVYKEDDVVQAVQELKEKINNALSKGIRRHEMEDLIDEVFGEESML